MVRFIQVSSLRVALTMALAALAFVGAEACDPLPSALDLHAPALGSPFAAPPDAGRWTMDVVAGRCLDDDDCRPSEGCRDGVCGCEPALYASRDDNCGCLGPCAQGDVCWDGACRCDLMRHLEDDSDCGCAGPCEEGQRCRNGTCRPLNES